jgi:hypothetical protein
MVITLDVLAAAAAAVPRQAPITTVFGTAELKGTDLRSVSEKNNKDRPPNKASPETGSATDHCKSRTPCTRTPAKN